ncbi:hypothetical protein [Arthrobacter bambusae]|uniref:hypothetical protein n=1 Tax=Arthrobacter bambusae TaxID=1338426 RepID=UPI0027845B7B|nr:hypothetical protein [Arthrobacter bambusae]MDQ0031552.1 hypothetical protein [Arthrobacter bambusae]MDQ0099775.1 hypothetical protein [Arthrobacter bambusae]
MGGMHGFGLKDRSLAELYRTTSGPVAFIDESYREPLHSDERPFYSMSAVIVGRNQGALVRDVLMDIPGSTYWHTTEAYRTPAGKRVIREMIDYIAGAAEYNIVTVQTQIRRDDPEMKTARHECLGALTKELTRGSGINAVRLLVVESRNARSHPGGDADDARVIKQLRSAGTVDRHVHVHHTSPAKEPLLWAADLSVWAFRRNLAVGDKQWFEPLQDISTVLHVDGADVSVKRSNPHLPQQSPGVQQAVSHESGHGRGRGPAVASASSVVFDGSESEALARIRRLAGAAGKSVDQEVALAVATNEPRRLVAAANAYLKQSRQPGVSSQPRTEAALAQAAQTIMKPDGAAKVTAALKQLRGQRVAEAEGRAASAPQQQRDRRPGYQR